jgi:hypothetical protein
MHSPNDSNDTPENRRAKVETCRVVILELFGVMDKHRLSPEDAMMVMTSYVLMLMPALERDGDVAQTREECAQRAADWFAYVRDCAARGETSFDIGVTGLPH